MRGTVVVGSVLLVIAAHAAAMESDVPSLPNLPSPQDGAGKAGSAADQATGRPGGSAQNPVAAPLVTAPDLDADPLPGTTPYVLGASLMGVAGLLAYAAWMGLGSRFSTPAEVLQNGVRERIYLYLRERVGANLKQITDDLALTTTNAIWHLRKLEDAGLIHSRRFNGYKVFYPAEGGVEARRLSLSVTALANENARNVFEFVVANPGTHQREIARALSVNHGTVRWHLKKLRRAEVLSETRTGKTSVYFATETGVTALANVRGHRREAAVVAAQVG